MYDPPENREFFQIRLLLNGVPDWLVYDIGPETEDRLRYELQETESSRFLFFKVGYGQSVLVSRPDIQAINLMRHQAAYNKLIRPMPRFEIYLRGRPTPYADNLGQSIDLIPLLVANEEDADQFLTFLDGDGEDVFVNLAELVLLHIVDEDDRLNVTTLLEVEGRFESETLSGWWAVQVWQDALNEQWYGNVAFREADENAEGVFEFDELGPFRTKTAAVEAMLADFDAGRYGQQLTEL